MKRLFRQIITFLLKLFSGYYILRQLIWWLRARNAKLLGRRLYIKDFIDWDNKYIRFIRMSTKVTFWILAVLTVGYIFLSNLAPFGITQVFSLEEKDPQLSTLSPRDRVEKEVHGQNIVYKQSGDLIYFTTAMPFHFDKATVRLTYQNTAPDQIISLGYKDQTSYHYKTFMIDNPFLNALSWPRLGNGLSLYQKNPQYTSVNEFLNHPPTNAIIGTYNLNPETIPQLRTTLPDYKPQAKETVIDTPLRGSHTLYAYLKDEKFIMSITKQDLNWYEGADPLTISIYKDGDQVLQEVIPDDGVDDASHKSTSPQELTIKNPGEELPEPGVYKIVLDTTGDVIIKTIKTNLSKLVFASPLYLAGNADVYHPVIASTAATTVFTNALALTAQTDHPQGVQTLTIGSKQLKLITPHSEVAMIPQDDNAQIQIPKSDVVLRGFSGYFSFSKEQFFTPTPYHIISVNNPEDLNLVDYLLTNYTPPQQAGDWKIATYTFNLSNAVVVDGNLSWVIQAPGLQESKHQILIKDIHVELEKEPLIRNK